jgi:hypothetical protein
MTHARPDRRGDATLVVLLALSLGPAFPYFSGLMNANERPRILQGIALVESAEWAIDGESVRGIAPGIDVARGADGRLYPNKPPGASLVAALARLVVGDGASLHATTQAARILGGLLPVLGLCALLLAWARRHASAESSRAAVTVLALASPLAAQAHLLFGHALAALLLALGAFGIVHAKRPPLIVAAGVAAGAAVGVDYMAIFAAPAIGGWLSWRKDLPRLAWAFAGALVPMVALGAYHDAVFGSPWATGYHHVVRDEFAQVHARGLLGLSWPTLEAAFEHWLSPWGGLVPFALPLVLGTIWARPERRGDPTLVLCVLVFGTFVLLAPCLTQTGGWRVGPRYLVCALPFAVPLLARALDRIDPTRAAILVAAVATCAVPDLLAANLFPHLVPVGNPLRDQLWPLLGHDSHGPFRALTGRAGAVPFAMCLSAFTLAFALAPTRAGAGRPVLRGALLAALALAVLAALPSAPDAAANRAAVAKIWEP